LYYLTAVVVFQFAKCFDTISISLPNALKSFVDEQVSQLT
jgi:hypothetical protein